MTSLRFFTSLFGTFLLAISLGSAQSALSVPKGATLMGGDSDAQVVLENGTIGVLYVRAVYEVQDSRGCKTLYLVAEENSFKGLAQIASSARSSVTISLAQPRMKVVVKPSDSYPSEILLGHLDPSGERVFVLTAKTADRWQ
jgi:hypothetical protein